MPPAAKSNTITQYVSPLPAVLECVHDASAVCEVQYRQEGEGQLYALEYVQPVIHGVQLVASEPRHDDRGRHGDRPRDENTSPLRPVDFKKTLKRKIKIQLSPTTCLLLYPGLDRTPWN